MSAATMPASLYGYADVGRFGLGHGLLAWARCIAWCQDAGARPIAPQWLRLRLGPYLRGERDKRFYHGLFRAGRQVGGLRRLRLLATGLRLPAETRLPSPGFAPSRDTVVVFSNANANNEAKHFHEVAGRSQLVRAALTDMTRPRFLTQPAAGPHIAVHVRGGDFATAKDLGEIANGRHNVRLPLTWYVEMLDALRQELATVLPTIVYSDCTDAELAPLLGRPGVRRSTVTAAITDMLAMAEASVLISSGSGFSRWGSYLGQVPRICYPGQRGARMLGPAAEVTDLEPECLSPSELPNAFVVAVKRAACPANTVPDLWGKRP